ncbi:rhodanese-like domain-containing protein, partial [Daejeonella sp.]|uniref:rhodanese-like domain-containing protein n=1 Tax=Daejeonella sp. TaxID=2805397 RepID=UPI003783F10B
MKSIIVDVRSVDEFNMDGHALCSVNYPLDQIESHIDTLREFDEIIMVCRSGNRVNMAMAMLAAHGITNVINKG